MSGQYHRSHKWAWFLERPGYVRSCARADQLLCGGLLIVLLVTLGRLGGGEAAFAEWLGSVSGPGWMVAHVIALIAAVWHSVTWFAAVPQAMPIYLGEKRLPAPLAAVVMGYGPCSR